MARISGHLGDWLQFRNGKSSPKRSLFGKFPVFGSNGEIGRADVSNVDQSATVIGRVGSYCGSTWFSKGPAWVTDNAIIATANASEESRFWYYVLRSLDLNGMSHGSGQPLLNQVILRELPFTAPDPIERVEISATLGALDDKIESNRRAAEMLFSLIEAKYSKVSVAISRKRLGAWATIVLGGTPSRKRPDFWTDGTVPWISSGEANRDIIMSPTEYITQEALDSSAAKLMPEGATVIAITGATLGQVALLGLDTSGNQSLVGVWGEDKRESAWLHFALRASVQEIMKSATGAAQQHVNKGNIVDLEVPFPPPDVLAGWASTCVPLMERAVRFKAESQHLAALRDALLPELLSGRMRVPSEAR